MSSTTVFVATMNGGKPKWSRYLFPFAIEAFAQLGNDLYIRHGDAISKFSKDADYDEVVGEGISRQAFEGVVWWPYLDFGQPGVTKMLEGFDVVGSGTPRISFGYDQRDFERVTAPYQIPADTLSLGIIPMPVSAPTLSVKLTYSGMRKWSLQAVLLYLSDSRLGT